MITLFLSIQLSRSGSDWLISLLDSHPNVCVPYGKAISGPNNALVGKDRIKGLTDVGALFDGAVAERLAGKPRRRDTNCTVAGWKMEYFRLFRGLWADGDDSGRESFAAWVRRRDVRVLLLKRTGLAWFVSVQKMVAFREDENHCASDACAEAQRSRKVVLDPAMTLRELELAEREWDALEAWARRALPRVRLVAYDALVADTPAVLNATFYFLGVAPATASSNLLKTSPRAVADSIENADEVRAALAGTAWAF